MQESLSQEHIFTPLGITVKKKKKQPRNIVYEFLKLPYEEMRTDNRLQISVPGTSESCTCPHESQEHNFCTVVDDEGRP